MRIETNIKIWGTLAGVFVLAVALIILIGEKCNPPAPTPFNQVKPFDSVKYWRNKAGDAVSTLQGTKAQFAVIEARTADSVAKVYGTRLKSLQEFVIAYTNQHADLKPDSVIIVKYDTITNPYCPQVKSMYQEFHNPYYNAQVQIGDTSFMHLDSHDTLSVLWRRVHRELAIDISFADTSRKVTGIRAYRIPDPKPKRWGIGPQFGVTYDGRFIRPYAGIGFSYNLIRF